MPLLDKWIDFLWFHIAEGIFFKSGATSINHMLVELVGFHVRLKPRLKKALSLEVGSGIKHEL